MASEDLHGRLAPARGVGLCVLEDGGLAFSEARQTIYRFNATAVLVWCKLWDEGLDVRGAARAIADLAGCSLPEADAIVAGCLDHWRELELIAPAPQSESPLAAPSPGVMAAAKAPRSEAYDHDCVLCAGLAVLITYPDAAVASSTRAVVAHLPKAEPSPAGLIVAVDHASGGYRVSVSGRDAGYLANADAVAANVKMLITDSLLEGDPDIVALHAAALLSPDGAVLLAGASGSGKTTLAAVLHADGWPAIADDIVLLNETRPAVRGLAFAFAAKPGSWETLRAYFPGLEAIRPQTRPDGRVVRYIPPLATADHPHGYAVRVVAFVKYEEGGTRAARVAKADALAALLSEAKNAREHLTLRGFRTLVALVRHAECVELRFSDAPAAARLIRSDFGLKTA